MDDRVDVVRSRLRRERAGTGHGLPRPYGGRRCGRCLGGDEVQRSELVIWSPSTPVGELCMESGDSLGAHRLVRHSGERYSRRDHGTRTRPIDADSSSAGIP